MESGWNIRSKIIKRIDIIIFKACLRESINLSHASEVIQNSTPLFYFKTRPDAFLRSRLIAKNVEGRLLSATWRWRCIREKHEGVGGSRQK